MILDLKKIFSILCVCAVAVSAAAVPARRGGIVRTSADGTEHIVFQHGDEYFHYITDENGNWLDEETLMPLTEEAKSEKLIFQEKSEAKRAKVRRAKAETGLDRLLSPRGAVILVSYADKAFSSAHDDMVDWAMGENYSYNGATGSIHKYFWEQSWGQYDLQIDVYGPVTVSKGYAYYGKDSGGEGNDQHADQLVVEACKIAHDSLGADFSQYDWDNDGKVDWVVIIYAGKGQADGGASNTIWPHQYELSYTGKSFKLDGKTVDHYCCLNEIDGQSGKRCGIGTFCHEFSHVMGLPDFYATDNSTHHTLCDWDIMDYGPYLNNGNTPPSYSAYERWFMGWFTPTLVNSKASVILGPVNERTAVYMTENGNAISNILRPSPSTFYMFEYRQKKGWDKYLPGEGLLITKVNWSSTKWYNNTVNNTSSNMGVDIIEAKSNTTSGYNAQGKATDLYPRGANEFTDINAYQVTNIALENELITFDINGGGDEINLGVDDVNGDKVQCTKVLRNGQVVIVRGGKTYDVVGRLVD